MPILAYITGYSGKGVRETSRASFEHFGRETKKMTGPVLKTSAHDDKRAHPRYKYVKPLEIIVAKRTIKGVTCDIGQGGISFIIDTMLVAGSVTAIIPDADLTLEGRLLAHQPTDKAGLYRHQMQFKEILLTAVLEEILS